MSINKFLEDTHNPEFISKHQIKRIYTSNMKQLLQQKAIKVYNIHYKHSNSKLCDKLVGTEIQEISCKQCNEKYYNIDTMLWTTLNMSENIIDSLHSEFNMKETLDWKCDKCNSISGTRIIRYWNLPEIWPIVLNRFGKTKNCSGINIPEEINIGKGIELQNEKSTKYELICIANHYGTLQSGHYNAICRETTEWVMYDDINIIKISNDKKSTFLNNNKNCYVLFYKRIY
jgi:ubiquitin C-terminal hydrolase